MEEREAPPIVGFRGLSTAEAEESRRLHGANVLTPPPRTPEWRKFLAKFDDATIKVLLAAALVSLVMAAVSRYALHGEGGFTDGAGILIAVVLATVVAYVSERRSGRAFDLLMRAKDDIPVKVERDQDFHKISIHDLVVGDLVHLGQGDKVPADGRLVSALMLTVDESFLTGESEPAEKLAEETPDQEVAALPRNMVFRGSMVLDGHGSFVVTEVGDRTEVGKIAGKLSVEKRGLTPLQNKLTALADRISVTGTAAALLIFTVMAAGAVWRSPLLASLAAEPPTAAGCAAASIMAAVLGARALFRGRPALLTAAAALPLFLGCFALCAAGLGFSSDPALSVELLKALLLSFVVAVTIIVVAVPEGLPMMVNVSLALNMRKMARESCLVRNLAASETIGCATFICTDKTGTLTENRMRPVWFLLAGESFSRAGVEVFWDSPEWRATAANIAINSSARLEKTESGVKPGGNPTECALLMLLHEKGMDYEGMRAAARVVRQLDHSSNRKLSLAVAEEDGGFQCMVKGAPEKILALCASVETGGASIPIEDARDGILAALREATEEKGLRVIAFSRRFFPANETPEGPAEAFLEAGGQSLTALVGIADPLRPEVPEAVETCGKAGIRVVMVTGDDPRTALSIARQCGIAETGGRVLDAAEFEEIPDESLPDAAAGIAVLARARPLDKLRLVEALRARGEVVAVTGDGTNDAPALKTADVGLSMGITGTEVAKEASDIVLLDDNFKSIVTGVRWGRALYENIQRFLQFQLSVNATALSCALLGPLVGVPLPLTVPQLLWINIIMDTFSALALSTDPPRPGAMSRKPVPRSAPIVTPAMTLTVAVNSLFQVAVLAALLTTGFLGGATELARLSIFFAVFVTFQFWHRFNCRSLRLGESPFQGLFKNRNFLAIVGLITLAQVAMIQAGGHVGRLFRTTPLSLETWAAVFLLTASALPVAWLARALAHRMGLEKE